jgi:hypothetical protein
MIAMIAMIVVVPAFLVILAATSAFVTAVSSFACARAMTLIFGALFHFLGIIDDVNRFIVDGGFFHVQGFGFGCAR